MAVKTYKYNDKTQLTPHFNVQEFKCKCGKKHDILIDSTLPTTLEKAMTQMGAKRCDIYSGYRCPSHDKNAGGSGGGPHTKGMAVDCYFTDFNGKRIDGQTVCLRLEDMGHKKGIGYRCGGSKPKYGNTHIDVKNRKWYGDESKSMTKSCCSSFYDYFGVPKPSPAPTPKPVGKTLTLTTAVYGRTGPGFKYKKTLYKKGTVVRDCTMNVAHANGYDWFKGYVDGKLVYFPWNKNWYK